MVWEWCKKCWCYWCFEWFEESRIGWFKVWFPYYNDNFDYVRWSIVFVRVFAVLNAILMVKRIVWKFSFTRKYKGFVEVITELILGENIELYWIVTQFGKWGVERTDMRFPATWLHFQNVNLPPIPS